LVNHSEAPDASARHLDEAEDVNQISSFFFVPFVFRRALRGLTG
jgi:hypothetical protein